MNFSYDLSAKYMIKTIRKLHVANFRGKRLQEIKCCEYIRCENKNYVKGDNVTCFIHCLHSYHTLCIERLFEDNNRIECIFCKQDNLE